ncbi:MAG TPA: anti-sigma regulatory factor [Polyangiales bacterium]|jgi:serine/threonine-protein kinase RsbT
MSIHELAIRDQSDVVRVRHEVRAWAAKNGFSVVDQTKIVTAASELARNTLIYGLGGTCGLEWIEERARSGLRLIFTDSGPGIPDIQEALRDGFTSGNGMGLGLGGARRLMSEFEIHSEVGKGTRITATRWKP